MKLHYFYRQNDSNSLTINVQYFIQPAHIIIQIKHSLITHAEQHGLKYKTIKIPEFHQFVPLPAWERMYEYPRHAGKKVILCMQVLFSHERNRSINQIRESLWASGRSSEWQRAEKKRKDARTFYEKERERERRENEKREERYSNFVPSLAPKISMCNNLSSGPAEVNGRTIPTTCMHNLCR